MIDERPVVVRSGSDVTLVAAGYSTYLCEQAAECLAKEGLSSEVVDLRILNPFYPDAIVDSVRKTRRLCVIDGGWRTAGMSAEVIASVTEKLSPDQLSHPPVRVTLPDASAPTSKVLEEIYYPQVNDVISVVRDLTA